MEVCFKYMFKLRSLISKAKKIYKTIVFPEAENSPRILKAVEVILKKKIAKVILLGDPKVILSKSKNLQDAIIMDPKNSELLPEFVEKLVSLRKDKGVDETVAKKLLEDNFYFACMLVYMGYADGYLGGTITPTTDVLRPALQIIKTKKDLSIVSSSFIMLGTRRFKVGEKNVLVLADCALNINPSAKNIKDITFETVKTAKNFCNIDPKVALLSFSSFGSGGDKDESILKMREALRLIKEKDPSLPVDGEMQADCALIKRVAKIKGKDSKVAGRANILIFPDLNSGNIAYKIMQNFGRLKAIGVIMQGFNKPANDLSRGCTVKDIIIMTAITSIQSNLI